MRFSSVLTAVTNQEKETDINATTVEQLVEELIAKYGNDFKERLIDQKTGKVRRFINVFVNGKDTRLTGGLKTPLKDNDEVSILPAVSGG
ncbi:MAG: MoaD family protein [Euryarchaeota archaeon]|nr:MoaD family protein [Euryarchaeota archaeon]